METTGDCTVVEDFSSASDLGVIFLAFGVDDFLGVRRGVFFGVVRAFIVWFVVFVVVEDRGMVLLFFARAFFPPKKLYWYNPFY